VLPTVADLLALDVIRGGSPQVVAGSGGLGARVRWVHVLELADAAHLLQGGERELGPLLAAEPDTSLLDVLAAYLAAGGSKAEAAKNSHLARPTFYERLRRIERISVPT
jgi:PucR family transcriptional regulator, purine catabolism regulatory protein